MPQKKLFTLAAAYALYRLDAQARRVTSGTLRTYRDRIEPFIRWCSEQGVTLLADISSSLLRSYLIHLQDRQLSSHTVNGSARAIKAFFRFCVAEELLDDSPMRRVAIPKADKKILPAFTVDDVQRLLAACESERDEAVVLFLLDTGLRVAELVNLNGGDVDLKTGAVWVRQGKGRKDRTVYMGARAMKQLLRYYLERGEPGEHDPVWTNQQSGERLTDSGVRQSLAKLGARAGVGHCSPHTFRRTCALWMLRSGASIYHVQRMLGHEDLSVLKQYLALLDADIQTAHKAHGAVDNMLT